MSLYMGEVTGRLETARDTMRAYIKCTHLCVQPLTRHCNRTLPGSQALWLPDSSSQQTTISLPSVSEPDKDWWNKQLRA